MAPAVSYRRQITKQTVTSMWNVTVSSSLYMMTFPMCPLVSVFAWFNSHSPLNDTWRNLLVSTCPPPACYTMGQSCKLIRLGSAGANHLSLSSPLLCLPPLVTLSSPSDSSFLGPPCGSWRWASPGGTSASSRSPACCLLENQQGGVLPKNKALTLRLPPLSVKGQLVGLCGTNLPLERDSQRREWVV